NRGGSGSSGTRGVYHLAVKGIDSTEVAAAKDSPIRANLNPAQSPTVDPSGPVADRDPLGPPGDQVPGFPPPVSGGGGNSRLPANPSAPPGSGPGPGPAAGENVNRNGWYHPMIAPNGDGR